MIDFLQNIINIKRMRRIVLLLVIFLSILAPAKADNLDIQQIYRDTPVPTLKYIHNIDPGENFDTHTSTWSPYPLFRLTTRLYFKSISIDPGYYLLTPREQDGNWYLLFKEAGKVKYVVPIYDRQIVPVGFYDENIPKPKLKPGASMQLKWLNFVGNTFKSSKRKPEAMNYLEVTDLENNFISLVLYWGNYKYYVVLRTIAL